MADETHPRSSAGTADALEGLWSVGGRPDEALQAEVLQALRSVVALRHAVQGYFELWDRCGGSTAIAAEAFADARQAMRDALSDAGPQAAPQPVLIKGGVYELDHFGPSEYLGLDHFHGETTHKFKHADGSPIYIKPEQIASQLSRPEPS